MLKIINKIPFQPQDLHKIASISRILLAHDGSVTKFIEALTNQPMKVKLITNQSLPLSQLPSFNMLHQKSKLNADDLIVRQTELSTDKLGILVYARSFWAKKAYGEIMGLDLNKAIGRHLIEQQLQIFRAIDFKGRAEIQLYPDYGDKNSLQLLCRSYSIKHKGQHICQIQQFYTQKLIDFQSQ